MSVNKHLDYLLSLRKPYLDNIFPFHIPVIEECLCDEEIRVRRSLVRNHRTMGTMAKMVLTRLPRGSRWPPEPLNTSAASFPVHEISHFWVRGIQTCVDDCDSWSLSHA